MRCFYCRANMRRRIIEGIIWHLNRERAEDGLPTAGGSSQPARHDPQILEQEPAVRTLGGTRNGFRVFFVAQNGSVWGDGADAKTPRRQGGCGCRAATAATSDAKTLLSFV